MYCVSRCRCGPTPRCKRRAISGLHWFRHSAWRPPERERYAPTALGGIAVSDDLQYIYNRMYHSAHEIHMEGRQAHRQPEKARI